MRTYLFPSLDSMSKYLSPERSFMPRGTFEQRRQVYDLVKAKNIAAETSPIFIQRTEDKIEIYLNACLCASLNCETEAVQLTAFGKQHFESQINAGQQPDVEAEFASFAFNLLSLAAAIETGRLHERSRLRVPFCEVVQVDELKGVLVKLYETDGEDYRVQEQQDGFLVLNSFTRREDYIPSAMYPMPNSLSPRLFFSGNTRELHDGDRLATLLDAEGITRQLGRAYSTVESELAALQRAGYDKEHSLEYYCGWVCSRYTTVWTHHAWLVVDGNCVIDQTAEKIGPISVMVHRAYRGQVPVRDQTELAAALKAFDAEKHSTKERIFYGKCDGWCYVGVPSNADEGMYSFRVLLGKYPHHPSYMNVDKHTFTNKLNRAYYGQT